MAVFNYLRKEIDAKIVYYGPGISGKTTNLQYIHEHLKQEQRGKMVSLSTDEDRTLFFDFLPIELESVRGFKTRFHLYTVPGQVYYGATRRAVLTGADGVILVADSQADRLEDNLISLKDLKENLRYYGKDIETIPFIIQYNKRDLPNILSVEELNQKMNPLNVPYFETVAVSGKGVFETLTLSCRLVLKAIEKGTEARRSPEASEPASKVTAARPLQTEKSIPRSEESRASGSEPAPQEGLRLKREVAPSEESGAASLDPAPKRGLQLERDVPRPEMRRAALEAPSGKTGAFRLEKDAPSAASPRPSRIPPGPGGRPEETVNQPAGRSVLSRVAEKKMPDPPQKLEEGGKISSIVKDKLRILSCGQPRISTPSSLEIPLTVEVEGFGKNLSFNLAIKLEQLDQKIK
jgi:signal recognition particle receptor subunit beta